LLLAIEASIKSDRPFLSYFMLFCLTAISNWNRKLPIPIELFDGRSFAGMVNTVYHSNTVENLYEKPD
jgi:hypothetical protein